MSLVLPLPQHHSQPTSHYSMVRSRSSTPRPTTPVSAPPTPVNATHLLPAAMERARSSETVLGHHRKPIPDPLSDGREGRKREVKDTILKGEWEHLDYRVRDSSQSDRSETSTSESDKMDIDQIQHQKDESPAQTVPLGETIVSPDQEVAVHLPTPPEEGRPFVWGMPKWGYEDERCQVREGVRLISSSELSQLVERHSMIDTPSSVMFPWLHGISDDGQKGREMAAFFGHGPPFEPPAYRGLCLLFCPPHPLDEPIHHPRSKPQKSDTDRTTQPAAYEMPPPRERSETMSTSSESYHSTGTTEGTSPSIGELSPQFDKPVITEEAPLESSQEDQMDVDVTMHPCDSKRVTPAAHAKGADEPHHPLPCVGTYKIGNATAEESDSSSTDSSEGFFEEDDEEDTGPTCILFNALHVTDCFDLPKWPHHAQHKRNSSKTAKFRNARLPHTINLRNLNIQQIKYSTVSDIVLYSKNGVGNGILEVAEQIAKAQQDLWEVRMQEFYQHIKGRDEGEGSTEPVKYGVWVVVEPFSKIEKQYPHLVNIDSKGNSSSAACQTDLFEREAKESRAMTRASEVVEGFWVGNDCDVPGGAEDGAGATIPFDLCVRASECSEMPNSTHMATAYQHLVDIDKRRQPVQAQIAPSWIASPATIALRNLLSSSPATPTTLDIPSKRNASPSPNHDERNTRSKSSEKNEQTTVSADHEYVSLECSGSCRTITGQTRNLNYMTDKVIELVYFLRKLVEGRPVDPAYGGSPSKTRSTRSRPSSSSSTSKTAVVKRRVLVHCQDGYTESSILVLSYIMSSLSCSLPEAYLHLQINSKRSFFLYPSDKPLLRKIDARLTQDRRSKALKLLSHTDQPLSLTPTPTAPSASTPAPTPSTAATAVSEENTGGGVSKRWKPWSIGMSFGGSNNSTTKEIPAKSASTVEVAKEMLIQQDSGPDERLEKMKVWFEDRRFDGFPSRILDFLYLGNLEHAGNAAMLEALGITHVVSVGESLINPNEMMDPYHGVEGNTLAQAANEGKVNVLDLTDVRDDGNDPLRPVIARACAWIEAARREGGIVLVHCRVGVSRSASIVIAYMMQFERMGLMDAYMMCRARRLNVLIQPNLRFFHELFGWEVELARQEEEILSKKIEEAQNLGVRDEQALKLIIENGDSSVYSDTSLKHNGRRRIMYSWPSFCRDLHCLNRRFLCN
ncbi:uncharacterized protein I206_102937 [Kwoniella pini CBS 10737]|uniref:Uncharacterized protein n=1 Tax=Kwoniella pini CBS 10737 TaxID=1296096 RepID=A0A1B9I6S5_9TREE|nr:uncharacterized protein I206_03288 [Kwoniella pini CBS 10737]OCF51222.1 hypothetical protein I206_03288 [Kwoniella pini CBS 10737]